MIKPKSIILLVLLPLLFLSLHYFVYLGQYKSIFDGNESFPDWFILVSSTNTPINQENQPEHPAYLHPFTTPDESSYESNLAVEEYPNLLFFLVQYLIAGLFLFETVKTIKTLK